jgi:hypothetical protein
VCVGFSRALVTVRHLLFLHSATATTAKLLLAIFLFTLVPGIKIRPACVPTHIIYLFVVYLRTSSIFRLLGVEW